jgi:hypothetical protein
MKSIVSTPAQQKRLGSKQFEFTNADWRYINDLQNILQPFFVATNIISAKNYPTLAAAYSGKLYVAVSLKLLLSVRINLNKHIFMF